MRRTINKQIKQTNKNQTRTNKTIKQTRKQNKAKTTNKQNKAKQQKQFLNKNKASTDTKKHTQTTKNTTNK